MIDHDPIKSFMIAIRFSPIMYRHLLLFRQKCASVAILPCLNASASTNALEVVSSHSSEKLKKINRAMVAYMEQARTRDLFIKREEAEYELGKRHLANMMGVDSNTMTKEDVNQAIEYLLPSGLFSKRSRPMMKPPEDLYPPQKPVQFDVDGRPYHSMFYTRCPNFYQILYDIREKIHKLQAYEDSQIAKGAPLPTEQMSLAGTDWPTVKQLSASTLEEITADQRAQLVAAGEDLVALPFSFLEADFIKKYRMPLGAQVGQVLESLRETILATVTVDENGRKTSTAVGYRNTFTCTVKLTDNGSGNIVIDGLKLQSFYLQQSRENVLFPFIVLNRLGQFDVEATSMSRTGESTRDPHSGKAIGEVGVTGAARHGISQALLAFVTPEEADKLRTAGLVSRDVRTNERKKINQKGARAKWRFKKR